LPRSTSESKSYRGISFWAYQLENYRRGPATIFFNALSYVWLLLRVLLGLALIDFGLYRADPSAFEFEDAPSFLVFVRYVIAGVYGGEIDALRPDSDLASALSISTFVIGLVLGGTLVLSSALSFRAARDKSQMQERSRKSDGRVTAWTSGFVRTMRSLSTRRLDASNNSTTALSG
jgi:hypothetical protein